MARIFFQDQHCQVTPWLNNDGANPDPWDQLASVVRRPRLVLRMTIVDGAASTRAAGKGYMMTSAP